MIRWLAVTTLITSGAATTAQTKAGLVPPREIDRAARKVEKSWAAWQEARPELGLLERPRADALASVDESDRMASDYVAAKKEYYTLIATAFRQEADELAQAPVEDAKIRRALIERQWRRLLNQEKALRAKVGELEGSEDERVAAIRQAYQSQLKALSGLEAEAHRELDGLASSALTEAEEARHRKAAAEAFSGLAATLTDLAETADLEAEDWLGYHEHLRGLIRKYTARKARDR